MDKKEKEIEKFSVILVSRIKHRLKKVFTAKMETMIQVSVVHLLADMLPSLMKVNGVYLLRAQILVVTKELMKRMPMYPLVLIFLGPFKFELKKIKR